MANLDLDKEFKDYFRKEREAEELSKKEVVEGVKVYPKDTPEEFQSINPDEFFNPLFS